MNNFFKLSVISMSLVVILLGVAPSLLAQGQVVPDYIQDQRALYMDKEIDLFAFYLAELSRYGIWGGSGKTIDTISDRDLDGIFERLKNRMGGGLRYLKLSAYGLNLNEDIYKRHISFLKRQTEKKEATQSNQTNISVSSCDQQLRGDGFTKLGVIFDALARARKIVPLSGDVRGMLQGIWSEKSLASHRKIPGYKVFGGYQCSENKILLEENLRPLNTTSLIAHELDHLYRAQNWNSGALSVRVALFLDEVLSYTTGGLIQIDTKIRGEEIIRGDSISRIAPWLHPYSALWRTGQAIKKNGRRFQPESDLTMYNRGSEGFLRKIFLSQRKSLCGTMQFILEQLGRGIESHPDVKGLARAISEGNFGIDESSGHLAELNGQVSWDKTPTLFRYLAQPLGPDIVTFTNELNQFAYGSEQSRQSCERFRAAFRRGELAGYIGVGANVTGGTQTGAEGGKVHDSVTLPGAEGGKVSSPLVRACSGMGF